MFFKNRNFKFMGQKARMDVAHGLSGRSPYQKILSSQGVLECLTGLPVQTDFIDFNDVLNGALSKYDVVLHYGERDNAFVGSAHWENPEVAAKVRAYIYEGGGFIGIVSLRRAERAADFLCWRMRSV